MNSTKVSTKAATKVCGKAEPLSLPLSKRPGRITFRRKLATTPASRFAATNAKAYVPAMSKVSEIQAALPLLTAEELQAVDVALRDQFRARRMGILYDDTYGLWTEEDQASAAAEAFALMDRQESSRGRP
jgi:hypothetical protein